ncbi:MAG: cytochrome c biogenesis protein CcdA [Thermoplasmatota archaeon]
MAGNSKVFPIIASILLVIFILGIVGYLFWSDIRTEKEMAPDFKINLPDSNVTSLRDFSGDPVLLHFTSIENPICLECEVELKEQVFEISELAADEANITIITINMRKNQYSEPGYELAREWWGVNVTWIWIEDPEPFKISGDYIDYWSIGSESANPTILLLDEEQYIVGIYHVYQMGKGKVDGIQTSEEMEDKVEKIRNDEWTGVEGQKSSIGGGSFIGMFVLGIITSFSPCSIALLFTVFTFIISSRKTSEDVEEQNIQKEKASKEGFLIGISFVLGMAIIFFILGLFIAQVGVFLQGARYFDLGAGAILIILGLNNVFSLIDRIGDIKDNVRRGGTIDENDDIEQKKTLKERSVLGLKGIFSRSPLFGAFLLGIFFSLGWAPCAVSLVLPVVVWILSQDISIIMGGLLFFVFGIGHGMIFIPLAIGTRSFSARLTQRFVKTGNVVKIVFGVLVVLMGIIFTIRFFGIKFW